jgi:HD superfamily phosphohydrolase YqeK
MIFRRVWKNLTRLVPRRGTQQPTPVAPGLPSWAQAGRSRHAHMRRMAALLEEWADAMDTPEDERRRWLTACWLHDALRDADLPQGTTHGAAAANRAASDGVRDPGVLNAVRHHSVGYAGWDDVGKMLYLADFLEPGRQTRRKQRAQMAKRVPHDCDAVLREILAQQIRSRLRRGKPIDPLTLEFWNSMARLSRD